MLLRTRRIKGVEYDLCCLVPREWQVADGNEERLAYSLTGPSFNAKAGVRVPVMATFS